MLRFITPIKRPFSFVNKRLHITETGATMVEYALMLALIALVAVAAVTLLGGSVKSLFSSANTCISQPSSTTCTSP